MVGSITAERLKEMVYYDRASGIFTWRVSSKTRFVGKPAGWIDNGYTRLKLDGRLYRAHRLAWLYVTGKWPTNEIDHRNRNRSDNSFANLREATRSQNQQNSSIKAPQKTGGTKGVFWHSRDQRWAARICINRHRIHLGTYRTIEPAILAYNEAAIRLFGEYACTT